MFRPLLFLLGSFCLSACMPQAVPVAAVTPSQRVQATSQAVSGNASWYGPGFAGRLTANGEVFDPSQLTAAHKTLPFGTRVRVTNLNNGRSIDVRINDRGPFKPGRVIDLSRAAAERIGMIGSGTAPVRLELLGTVADAPLQTAVDTSLEGYSVLSAQHRLGELLLLSSSAVAQPLMVRVVGTAAPEGVDLMISPDIFARLGEIIVLLNP